MATGWRLREERGERRQSLGTDRGGERPAHCSELRQKMQEISGTKSTVTLNGMETEILKYLVKTWPPFIINQGRNPLETSWGLKQIYIQVDNIIDIDFYRESKRKLSGKVESSRSGARNVMFDVADFHIYFFLGKENIFIYLYITKLTSKAIIK